MIVAVGLVLGFFPRQNRSATLIRVPPTRIGRVIPARGRAEIRFRLVDRHGNGLDLRRVGKLHHPWPFDELIPHRGGLVRQIRIVFRIRRLPLRFVILILPLGHDDFGLGNEREFFHQRGILVVVGLLRVTGGPDDPAIHPLAVDVQHLPIAGPDGDRFPRHAAPGRLIGVPIEDFEAVDLAPVDRGPCDLADVLQGLLVILRRVYRLPCGVLTQSHGRVLEVVILRNAHRAFGKPVLRLIPEPREVREAGSGLPHCRFSVEVDVLIP